MPTKKKKTSNPTESDGMYFLKIVLYIVMGSLWIKFTEPVMVGSFQIFGIPAGLMLGLLIARHDRFQIDRKIEYAVLIIVAIVSFIVPYTGIFI